MSNIQTTNLSSTFQALRNKDPSKVAARSIESHPDYKAIPRRNYGPVASVDTGSWGGGGMKRIASGNSGIMYGQPGFFSPVHTPINWQIPSKRLEIYQWLYLPHTEIILNDYTYKEIEDVEFDIKEVVEDTLTDGFIFEALNFPEILNSNGDFVSPPRISTRKCENKRCFVFAADGNYRDIKISEEHNIFVLDGVSYRKAKKKNSDKKYRIKNGVLSKQIESVREKFIKRIQAHEVKSSDYLLSPIPKIGEDRLNEDLAWLVGFCAADGCIFKTKTNYTVSFTGAKGEIALQKAQSILESNFSGSVSSVPHGDGNGWRVRLGTKAAHDFFRRYILNKSINKKFSSEIFKLDKESRLNVLAGYFDGDGCFSKSEKKLLANCFSKDLSDQIYWLLLSCDIICSIGKHDICKDHYPTKSTCYYRVNVSSSQTLELSKRMKGNKIPSSFKPKKQRDLRFFYTENDIKYLAQPISKIEEVLHTGPGYDLEMPNEMRAFAASGYVCSNCRFFYQNEPKVASAIDFYSLYPMSGWVLECKDRKVKAHFDKLNKRINLIKWCRLISHEVHLLGDCFPNVEVACEHCNGTGRVGSEVCEHEGGTVKRVSIFNPDYIDVLSGPLDPEPIIAYRPDESLIKMVSKKGQGYDKLNPEVVKLIMSGQPIPISNKTVCHLKYGESGYETYGTGMVKRLFPTLSYKTKLMMAQWVVAERLIVPIKLVKVGTDDRPAGPSDIAEVQAQLAQTANDPNLTIVTHNAFEMQWIGASGQVLTLSNEFELINQEILDGLMINNALLNGEGPAFASASVGIEATIERLKTFRDSIAEWIYTYIYIPEAKRQGFIEEDADGEEAEYIVPKIKWNKMNLRDEQQNKTFAIQLYEKGLLSANTVLEIFEYDPDQEIERKRYDAVQMMALGQGAPGQDGDAGGGGMPPMGGGGGGGGGLGDLGGLGGGDAGGGGEPPIGAPAGGGGDAGGPIVAKSQNLSTIEIANPAEYGGKVLKQKSRDRYTHEKQKIFDQKTKAQNAKLQNTTIGGGMRDEKGRIVWTKPERQLIDLIIQKQKDGIIRYKVQPQFEVSSGTSHYMIDFAIIPLKLGIEADGETFHGSEKQKQRDEERDMKLSQQGWTIIRFTDTEIDKKPQEVINAVVKQIMQKEMWLKQQAASLKQAQADEMIKTAESMDRLVTSNANIDEPDIEIIEEKESGLSD